MDARAAEAIVERWNLDSDNNELLIDLLAIGCVPVIASIGVAADGTLLNINADTFAAHLAATIGADRLLIAGGTAGVLDAAGRTLDALSVEGMDGMIAAGTVHSGMVAKLTACRYALLHGVGNVAIVHGHGVDDFTAARGTRIEREMVAR